MAKVRAKRAVPVRFFKAKMWEGVKPPKEIRFKKIKRVVLMEHHAVVNTVTVTSTFIYSHVHVRLYIPFQLFYHGTAIFVIII